VPDTQSLNEVVVLDTEHPCLNCGAPWRVVVEPVQASAPAMRARVGTCSARCWSQNFDGYNAGLLDRLDRGWHADLWSA
jgi:hypothetical protein